MNIIRLNLNKDSSFDSVDYINNFSLEKNEMLRNRVEELELYKLEQEEGQ